MSQTETSPHDRGATEWACMPRVTVRLPSQLLDDVEHLVDTGVYPNRSVAIRELLRDSIDSYQDGGDSER